MNIDKTIRRATEREQQQAETYRYCQSLSIGERLSAVWDVSADAYAFADGFKGTPLDDARRSQRIITRVQRSRVKYLIAPHNGLEVSMATLLSASLNEL